MGDQNFWVKFTAICLKQDKVSFTPINRAISFVVYEWDKYSKELNADFIPTGFLFRAVQLTKSTDPDKHFYLWFDSRSRFSISKFWLG